MSDILKRLAAALAAAAMLVTVAGCQKEGPVERAGKEIDKAVDKTKDALKK